MTDISQQNKDQAEIAAAKVLAEAVIAKSLHETTSVNYTNREVDLLVKQLDNRMSYQDELLEKIDERLTFQNGSIGSIQKWREQMIGGMKLAGFLGFAAFVGLILFWFKLFK